MPAVTKAELARNLGVSAARVSQYIAKGLPVLPSGKIDLDAGTRWIADNCRPTERSAGKGAARAVANVKAQPAFKSPPLKPKGEASRLVAALDALVRAVGPIVASAAVEAGGSIELAYAVDAIASQELCTLAERHLSGAEAEAFDPFRGPFGESDPLYRSLAEKLGQKFDGDACDAFLEALPWTKANIGAVN